MQWKRRVAYPSPPKGERQGEGAGALRPGDWFPRSASLARAKEIRWKMRGSR